MSRDGGQERNPAAGAVAPFPAGLELAVLPPRAQLVPLWNRILDGLGVRAATAGLAISLGLVAVLVARDAWLGRLAPTLADPADLYVSIVESLLIGYLVAARVSVARAARATLDALGDALSLTPARRASLREEMGRYFRLRFLAAGLLGATLGALAPLLIRGAATQLWSVAEWSPEFEVRRGLAPVIGWMFGTYVLATTREAARVSDLAQHLRSVDLFEAEALRPFSRFGLQVAFRAVGLVSLTTLMITEPGFGRLVVVLVVIAAGAAAAGLLLPVRGLRDRICAEKRRELLCCHAALRRARDALLEERSIATEAMRLSDVVAYKQLVESIAEWPIDTPTALRACGCVGLPILSWLSGSVAPDAVLRVLGMLVS